MPATDLKVVQLGQETTWGTAVAATARLMGLAEASIHPVAENVKTPYLGNLSPSMLDTQVKMSAEGAISAVGTYEDILYFLCGLFGLVSPSGTASPYTWSFSAPLTSKASPLVYSVEYGASGASYVLSGAIMKDLEISVEAGGLWQVKANVLGEDIATVSLASLNDRTVEAIRAADTKVYMDGWGDTMGTTEVSGTLIAATLSVDAKRHLKNFITGLLTPYDYGESRWDGSLTLTLEYNATAKAVVDALLAPALIQRQIRLKAESGTKVAQIDFCGSLEDAGELFSDRDGNMTIETSWTGTYHSTVANWLEIEVQNAVSTLT